MLTPSFWYRPPSFKAWLLWPLSLIYRVGRRAHVTLTKAERLPWPVICVGNLVAGGAGKTPTVLALIDLLQHQGIMPQVVTRGFGGRQQTPHRVQADDDASVVGDESLLLAQAAPTWVARDRRLGIGSAIAAGTKIVLLDDGLQSVKLHARVNLLVIDGESGFGNGMVLPAGPLRELPADVIKRVDAVILIGDDKRNVMSQFTGKPVFKAVQIYDLSQLDLSDLYFAFAGLARPEKFFAAAQAQGLRLDNVEPFPDHHPYDAKTRAWLQEKARKRNAKLLTTAKDAVRWPEAERAALRVLPLRLQFTNPTTLLAWLQERCPEAFTHA